MFIATNDAMRAYGAQLGSRLRGDECFELIGDVGAGKTTLVQGIAEGLGVDEDVQSPSFTLSREYAARDGLTLAHYDFYRLHEAGVMSYELAESLQDPATIVVVEWGETIGAVLPDDRIVIRISYRADGEGRDVDLIAPESRHYVEDAA
ncbi:MAG: tRNA (adenosine(37)-N6)-threonylcarbamoyltransferase complex ATPase subunit type 1 TsaE [Candidatus Saccharimonadales bacterium]